MMQMLQKLCPQWRVEGSKKLWLQISQVKADCSCFTILRAAAMMVFVTRPGGGMGWGPDFGYLLESLQGLNVVVLPNSYR